ncbi:MAG: sortase [Anaerolineae bacterium]|nr:sortase [Anaerolineae bacterium]
MPVLSATPAVVLPMATPTVFLSAATPTLMPGSTPMPTSSPTSTSTPSPTPTPARPPAGRPPDRIQVPSINLDATVVEVERTMMVVDGQYVSTWAVADYAAGFHSESVYPGHVGNTVLSGHNNIRGEVFRDLVDVQVGDEVVLYVGEQVYRYRVREKLVLPDRDVSLEQRQENARWIGTFPDERLTLVTCWPYTSNSHRVIVVAFPEIPQDLVSPVHP